MSNINILKNIKSSINKCLEEKKIEKLKIKQKVIYSLKVKWTEEQIKIQSLDLMINSSGCLGGDCSEGYLKTKLLESYYYLFTEEEYDELYQQISSQKEMER